MEANVEDRTLSNAIATALYQLEVDGELVVTSSSIQLLADRIAEAVYSVVPHTELSLLELIGVRSLILHAVWNKSFFDWEMPTLTGFTADEFKTIADKLPRD
jgi:hypothetical protein